MAAASTHRGWPQGTYTCHRWPRQYPYSQSPGVATRAAAPTSPEPVHPAGVLWRPQTSHHDARPLNAWLEMTGTCGQAHKETHPSLPSTLTQASVFPPYSWAQPQPSTRMWPSLGTSRLSSPPSSMVLAGGPRTHSPCRHRLRSWPRGSAHAQRLRPAGGTHCRTRVARGLRAVPRPGCGRKRAVAVAGRSPEAEAAEQVPSASQHCQHPPPFQPERLPQLSGVVV